MRRVWWIVGIAAVLLVLYWTALPNRFPAGLSGDDRLSGTYIVNGVDPAGVEYSGTAVIVERGDGYTVEWIVTNGVLRGTGDLRGDTFVVEWTSASTATAVEGRVVYALGPSGVLTGVRTVDGIDGSGTEELVPEP